jgi:predicted ATP-dependent protease
MHRILKPSDITLAIDPASLGFADTSELTGDEPIWIGQERAETAARFGLSITQPDYNLFVLGETGSGRSSLLFRAMQQIAAQRPTAPDFVYVHHFDLPEKPIALRLQPGKGAVLRQRMETFVREIVAEIPRKLDEEGYRLDCSRARKNYQANIDAAYAELSAMAATRNYALRREGGRLIFNLLDDKGQAIHEEDLLAMSAEQRVAIEHAEDELRASISDYLEKIRPQERAMDEALNDLRRATIQPLLDKLSEGMAADLAWSEADARKLEGWMGQLLTDVLNNLDVLAASNQPAAGQEETTDHLIDVLASYRVNVVVDNAGLTGAPVVRDDDPVFRSLFGGIEYQAESGVLLTDFTRIRAGNLLRAHGGFLMLHLDDLIRDPQVWEKFRRFLRNGRLQIEEPAAALGQLAASTLEPEAVGIRVKIVLIGSREEYYELQELDPEFSRHFRAKVDFAESFVANDLSRRATAAFVAQACRRYGLAHFEAPAVATLLADMQREMDDQHRQSSAFGKLEAWLVESASMCAVRGGMTVTAADVESAAAARRLRHDYPEQELHQAIADGEILIDVEGERIGQINGLTQIDLGDYRFGSPVRISARAYAGDEGIVNISREVEMSGPNHDKGVLILQHWLAATFINIAPLSLSASLVFEQEYHGVEGDSASCAELFALISALGDIPLPQGLAVTGALNQHGEVLPIGGLNEKIEGYFRVCQRLGLNGKQGVIVPARNRNHIILDREVVEAVARGEFHIHVIDNVFDGLAILSGLPVGEADDMGYFPAETVLGRVQRTLENFRKACDFAGHPRDKEFL